MRAARRPFARVFVGHERDVLLVLLHGAADPSCQVPRWEAVLGDGGSMRVVVDRHGNLAQQREADHACLLSGPFHLLLLFLVGGLPRDCLVGVAELVLQKSTKTEHRAAVGKLTRSPLGVLAGGLRVRTAEAAQDEPPVVLASSGLDDPISMVGNVGEALL